MAVLAPQPARARAAAVQGLIGPGVDPAGFAAGGLARSAQDLYPSGEARSAGETPVAGEERTLQRFGEGDVDGVVGAQVVAERPDAIEEGLVIVSFQVQRAQVVDGRGRRVGVERAFANVPPQRLRDLDVHEMGDVQAQRRITDPDRSQAARLGPEQQLQKSRGVENDQRASRSARMAWAAGRRRRRTGRARSRSRTS